MRIAHIAAFHQPGDVRIFHKECRALAEAGHEVTFYVPGTERCERDGVTLVDLGVKEHKLLPIWLVRCLRAVLTRGWKIDADVLHFHEADMIPAMLVHKLRGKTIVYDAHEDAPRQIRTRCRRMGVSWAAWPASIYTSVIDWLAKRAFDRFVCATPYIATLFPPKRTVTVCNFPRLDEFAADASIPHVPFRDRPNWVAYVGALSEVRGSGPMIDAMASDQAADAPDSVRLQLAGPIEPSRLRDELAARPGWASVDYHGTLPRDGVSKLLSQCRAGLLLFQPEPNHVNALPNKLFEYMAAGLPIVASDFPLWREIIGDTGCGLVIDPADPNAIRQAIARLVRDPDEAEQMGRRGREAVEREFNWEPQQAKLIALYDELAARRGPKPVQ